MKTWSLRGQVVFQQNTASVQLQWKSEFDSKLEVAQSCPTICNPLDYIVHGILQARILEWVAVPFSRVTSQPRDRTQVSCITGIFFTSWAIRAEKAMAPHSSTFAWKIPWTQEPGRLQSMGSLRVGHDWLHFHSSLSCVGEGNGNPLQCSCLENPRDGGAWWAAVYGVTQSWTQLKQLSSSRAIREALEYWSW